MTHDEARHETGVMADDLFVVINRFAATKPSLPSSQSDRAEAASNLLDQSYALLRAIEADQPQRQLADEPESVSAEHDEPSAA